MTMDVVGTPYENEDLYDYFDQNVNNQGETNGKQKSI